jgi:methylmalonyl-CoA mutase
MSNQLFEEFNKVSSKEWKNKIQYELKGIDYNETLVWESLEGIKVRPFYHGDEDYRPLKIDTETTAFAITQRIYVFKADRAIEKTKEALQKGAEVIYFTIDNPKIDCLKFLEALPKESFYFFTFNFLNADYVNLLSLWAAEHSYNIKILLDPVYHLLTEGNWYKNLDNDFNQLAQSISQSGNVSLQINNTVFQNAGANMVQQTAYTIAHLHEYLHRLPNLSGTVYLQASVGTNYFFEIAKLRAMRMLANLITKEYNSAIDFKIITIPTKRNKTLYDYNVNMLRTTTECMSAILGGADFVSNLAYDEIYHKENEFADRIARNQLLILKQESYFNAVNNPTEGAYYIENITLQIAEQSLSIFKQIEKGDGLISSLIEGTIQRKVAEAAQKEQDLFDNGKEVLVGTNKYPNPQDNMKHDLELYPFVKQNPRKTLITPIIERRLAEKLEKERLEKEK